MGKVIYVKTTDTCNLSCSHCFTNGYTGKLKKWEHERTSKWVLDLINETKSNDTHIEFHGGEPMLVPVQDMRDFKRTIVDNTDANLSFGITTNLVYKLTDAKLSFFVNDLNGNVATSWDPAVRFKTEAQYNLWKENLEKLEDAGIRVKLFVSITKQVIQLGANGLISALSGLPFSTLDLERITLDGDAVVNSNYVKPDNIDVDRFMYNLYKLYKDGDVSFNILTIDTIIESYITRSKLGTKCRTCEQSLFTVNRDGTVGGCPNGATHDHSEHSFPAVQMFLNSQERLDRQVKELSVNEGCMRCSVFDICGGDCYKTAWDSTGCPGFKSVLKSLKNGDGFINLVEVV